MISNCFIIKFEDSPEVVYPLKFPFAKPILSTFEYSTFKFGTTGTKCLNKAHAYILVFVFSFDESIPDKPELSAFILPLDFENQAPAPTSALKKSAFATLNSKVELIAATFKTLFIFFPYINL